MNHAKSGFTIIEIMIVIMIMGVLAVMAFAGFRYLQQVRIDQTTTKLAALDAAIERYRTHVNEYPSDLAELVDGPSKPQLSRMWRGPYVDQQDLEDPWNQQFVYTLNPRGSRPPYDLYSMGPTGESTYYSPASAQAG